MKRALVLLALALTPPANAQETPQTFTPEVEKAARELGKSLRCVVCQNQSIEDSGAPLAADMRRMVRERLAAGERRDQVIAYMTDRYGNFVLLNPPFQVDTLFLWLGPALFAALAAWGWFAFLRPGRTTSHAPSPLSEDEMEELRKRMSQGPKP